MVNVKIIAGLILISSTALSANKVFSQIPSPGKGNEKAQIFKLKIQPVKALSQSGNTIIYSVYEIRKLTIRLQRNIENHRDSLIINQKRLEISYCCRENKRLYPTIDFDALTAFRIAVPNKSYFVLMTAYSGASGKQANYSLYLIIDTDLSRPKMLVTESYLGKITNISYKNGGLFFAYKKDENSREDFIKLY